MKTIVLAVWLLPATVLADALPEVTDFKLMAQTDFAEKWVQLAMRDGDFNLYAFSSNVGFTNWSFVTGGRQSPKAIYTAPVGNCLRDPAHIRYKGKYYLLYNNETLGMGVASSPDDVHWTYLGEAHVGYGTHWSPKFFIDGDNVLWCNVRYSDLDPGIYCWQQYAYRFDINNPTNTINRDGRYICTNIWFRDNGDRPTAQIVWNNGLFYLINQAGDEFCSPTLLSNGWTQIGTNLFGADYDGPCLAKYQGVWYINDSQNGATHWYMSLDLTNWSPSCLAGWSNYGLKEGTAIVERYPIQTLRLTWNPNYSDTDQATVIIASDDPFKPRTLWPVVFTGRTNECVIANDRPVRYFSAYNIRAP